VYKLKYLYIEWIIDDDGKISVVRKSRGLEGSHEINNLVMAYFMHQVSKDMPETVFKMRVENLEDIDDLMLSEEKK
jgi:hypothetical protein